MNKQRNVLPLARYYNPRTGLYEPIYCASFKYTIYRPYGIPLRTLVSWMLREQYIDRVQS